MHCSLNIIDRLVHALPPIMFLFCYLNLKLKALWAISKFRDRSVLTQKNPLTEAITQLRISPGPSDGELLLAVGVPLSEWSSSYPEKCLG